MDEFRINSVGSGDSPSGQTKDESQNPSKRRRAELQELTDQVILTSDGDREEPPLNYAPGSFDNAPE